VLAVIDQDISASMFGDSCAHRSVSAHSKQVGSQALSGHLVQCCSSQPAVTCTQRSACVCDSLLQMYNTAVVWLHGNTLID
jgi:hypothetical protein